jgi:hypothetical protein
MPRNSLLIHSLRRRPLLTGSAKCQRVHNNPLTTIDPGFQTNERLREAGCSGERSKAAGRQVQSRGGDAMACLLCSCVASVDRVGRGGQRRPSRWHLPERGGLCRSARVHPLALSPKTRFVPAKAGRRSVFGRQAARLLENGGTCRGGTWAASSWRRSQLAPRPDPVGECLSRRVDRGCAAWVCASVSRSPGRCGRSFSFRRAPRPVCTALASA